MTFERITFDPDILGGRACIRGMRMTAAHVVGLVAEGLSTAAIVEQCPDLEPEDIKQALEYARRPTPDSRTDESYRRAYAGGGGLGPEFEGWEEEAAWPKD